MMWCLLNGDVLSGLARKRGDLLKVRILSDVEEETHDEEEGTRPQLLAHARKADGCIGVGQLHCNPRTIQALAYGSN